MSRAGWPAPVQPQLTIDGRDVRLPSILVATMTVTVLFGAVVGWAFPPVADHAFGVAAGYFVGVPSSAGVFAWYSNGVKDA
ncbi:hypothetical protein ACWGQ5_27235 [Streptomyces sp. NPDC055722]